MPAHPRQCTHIKVTGQRCGSPALRREFFCYFHTRVIKGVQLRPDMRFDSMALLEDPEAVQFSLMRVVDGLMKGTIEPARARLIIQALRIAARNIKEARFDNCYYEEDGQPMVREVPNYAEQYLLEHPELDPPLGKEPQVASVETAGMGTVDLPVVQKPTWGHPPSAVQRGEAPQPSGQASIQPQLAEAHPAIPNLAAERRQNAAHGASRGSAAVSDPAPEERKNHAASPGEHKFPPMSELEAKERKHLEKVEAAIPGAERGNWRDLKTVLDFAGITPLNGNRNQKPKDNQAPGGG